MVERLRERWIPNTTESVSRQWMEYDGRFLPERPPFSPGPERFNYAGEDARGECAKHEEHQRAHGRRFHFDRDARTGRLTPARGRSTKPVADHEPIHPSPLAFVPGAAGYGRSGSVSEMGA